MSRAYGSLNRNLIHLYWNTEHIQKINKLQTGESLGIGILNSKDLNENKVNNNAMQKKNTTEEQHKFMKTASTWIVNMMIGVQARTNSPMQHFSHYNEPCNILVLPSSSYVKDVCSVSLLSFLLFYFISVDRIRCSVFAFNCYVICIMVNLFCHRSTYAVASCMSLVCFGILSWFVFVFRLIFSLNLQQIIIATAFQ